MHVSKPIFWSGHLLASLNRTVSLVVTLMLLNLSLHGEPRTNPPRPLPVDLEHPAFDAADADWNLWLGKHAAWIQGLDFRTRYDVLYAQAENLNKKSSDYDWRMESRFQGLTLKQIQALASGGIVATGREYVLGAKPEKPVEGVFVTSDMILHAYNMMVADFVRGIETQRAPRLRRSLETMWDEMQYWRGLRGKHPELAQPALAHARRVIGTALLCLGSTVEFHDVEVERDCRAQMQLIMSATAKELPPWLAPDDDFVGIDYTRMKPVGIYTENKTLSDLFRAVRWLQVIPFRPQRDRELIAFAILADKAESSGLVADQNVQRQWLGLPNCLTLVGQAWLNEQVVAALRDPATTANFEGVRANLVMQGVPVHANDDVRLDPKLSGRASLPPLLKIFPAYLTADSLLFSEILLSGSPSRLPEGRMITAYLGDASAIPELQQVGWNDATVGIIRKATSQQKEAWISGAKIASSQNPYEDNATFNSMLLHALTALFLPPADGAPAFMAGPAWLAKTRNTVLSAWAEKKHTWVLHEVEAMSMAKGRGPPPPPPGLIEPNPEFFRRLAVLAECNIQWMEQNHFLQTDVLNDFDRSSVAESLKVARVIHELGLDTKGNPSTKVSWDDFVAKISRQGIAPPYFPREEQWTKFTAADFEKVRESALLSAEAILYGLDSMTDRETVIRPPEYRRGRWKTFLNCVQLLEKMSEKQLRGEEWSKEEREYLTFGIWNDYYEITYLGDNGQHRDPQSLGPKIAPVASDPNSGLVLHVGTGDLSEIYVLYPWKGTSYLYRGPIIPYYEFSSRTRLDDQDWRALLKSEKPPLQPEWLAPLRK